MDVRENMQMQLDARLARLAKKPAAYKDICSEPHSDARGDLTPALKALHKQNSKSALARFPVRPSEVSWRKRLSGYRPHWVGPGSAPDDLSDYLQKSDLNPQGRTGAIGPGTLVKADDPEPLRPRNIKASDLAIFGYDEDGDLCVVVVERDPNKCLDPDITTYAIPGGRVDEGEDPRTSAMREALEEVFGFPPKDLEGLTPEDLGALLQERGILPEKLHHFYSGYGDDPRNTDTVYMTTDAFATVLDQEAFATLKKSLNKGGHQGTGDENNPEIRGVTTIKVKRFIDGKHKDHSIAAYGSHKWFLKHLVKKALPLKLKKAKPRTRFPHLGKSRRPSRIPATEPNHPPSASSNRFRPPR